LTSKPIVAGWLDILAGVLWLLAVGWSALIILGFSVGFGMPQGAAATRLWAIFSALALPAFLVIAGGISSLKRLRWLPAFIGSIIIIPTGFGIASVILLARSKNEFA
jgi:hypothetical protein